MLGPLLAVVLCAQSALGAGGDERSGTDPDRVEELVEAIHPWLEGLERWVLIGEPPALATDAVLAAPPPSEAMRETRGRFEIARLDAQALPAVDVDALRVHLVDGVPERVKTKVVAVRAATEEIVDARLRIEVVGPSWQSVAHADVVIDIELRDGSPLAAGCRSLRLDSPIERVRASSPLFVERTAGVFADAPDAARLLGLGADRWAQRLDDPALSAWFGHQGIAAGDVDGDGREDLYVAMPSGLPNLLLVQQPDGTVRDIAAAAGVAWLDDTKGVMLVDVDADGRLDVVSALGHVIAIQLADGEGSFRVAGLAVAPDEAPFYGISAADIDADGDLDLFGARYVRTHYADTVPVPFEDARNGPSNHLFRNDAGRFVDVTTEVGLDAGGGRFSLQGVFTDFDLDGDPDLYVVNDFGRNQMFVLEDGRYVDRAEELGIEDQGAGMGASWSDFDRDGDLDLYVSNMFSSAGRRVAFQPSFGPGRDPSELAGIRRLSLGNSLFVREGDRFVDRADALGVRMGRWAWGAVFCDLDADGFDDIVSPSGFLTGPEPGDL